jgi:hypothetical protein
MVTRRTRVAVNAALVLLVAAGCGGVGQGSSDSNTGNNTDSTAPATLTSMGFELRASWSDLLKPLIYL